MTDPIADMLTRIKNALMAGHAQVVMPHSKMKQSLAGLLKEAGFVEQIEVRPLKPQPELVLNLKYIGKTPAITQVVRVSKPGRRVYRSAKKIPLSLGGYGLTIVSTSSGVVSDKTARQKKIGGEIICQVW